jgi:hydroxyacylglutathione hydrolase
MTGVAQLAPGLCRLRAPNPSALTGTGTNTYLLGEAALAVIDPGPDLPQHLAAILAAARGRPITHILVTHPHRDHSALAPRLAAVTGARVLAFGTARDGLTPRMAALTGLGGSTEGLDLAFTPDRRLLDGDLVSGPGWEIEALHTPGHLGSHLCLGWGDLLFSGDHVMGWSTSIVSPPDGDMGDYMASLARLDTDRWRRFLPGHGDPVDDPRARVGELIRHRRHREGQILDALAGGPADAGDLTLRIYTDIPPALLPAARRNVLAHLVDLEARNLVVADPRLSAEASFRRC